jgi:hypothetical protein
MLKTLVIVAGTTLFAATAFAQSSTVSKTPGHQMQDAKEAGKHKGSGASQYTPGHKMQDAKDAGTHKGKGASSYTPPSQTTTGSSTTRR